MRLKAILVVGAALLISCGSAGGGGQPGGTAQEPSASPSQGSTAAPASPATSSSPTGAAPATSLSAGEIAGLTAALSSEYLAAARYQQVLSQFGGVKPFATVASAESSHIAALQALFSRYSVAIPPDPGAPPATYTDLSAACSMGVQQEQSIIATYDSVRATTSRSDLLAVYSNVEQASRDNHLPAFQRC